MRLLVGLLVMITMGAMCELSQMMCLAGGGMSMVAGAITVFIAFFGYVWMGIHSNALTR
ncbi:unnamed protein product [Gongylonema pulchrum]|nr:unnamed protein product [Gongylonema pulchrum]